MKVSYRQDIKKAIATYYLESRDFNGISLITLMLKYTNHTLLLKRLAELVTTGHIGVLDIETDENPHILRIGFEDKDTQVKKIIGVNGYHICIYPKRMLLEQYIERAKYMYEPYRLELALGEPQLSYRVFDLAVLENYRNDPRYSYKSDDLHGSIQICSETSNATPLAENEKIFIRTFGFAYNENHDRVVAVFLRYLSKLSPEHQMIWKVKEVSGEYKLNYDYYMSSINGQFPTRLPIFQAICMEIYIVNQMTQAILNRPLFRMDFGNYGEDRPEKLAYLLRPTLDEFNAFTLLLNNVLVDNIDTKAFEDYLDLYKVEYNKDGSTSQVPIGGLNLLNEWFRTYFKTEQWEVWDKSYKSLKLIRKTRQKPAHTVQRNVYDQSYIHSQRDLVVQAYDAVRTIRMMIENHPNARPLQSIVSKELRNGLVWIM